MPASAKSALFGKRRPKKRQDTIKRILSFFLFLRLHTRHSVCMAACGCSGNGPDDIIEKRIA